MASLFSGIAQHASLNDCTLYFPEGCYGHFLAAAQFYGVKTKLIRTRFENSFKISGSDLESSIGRSEKSVIFLNAPIVNPTGAIYTQKELDDLFITANLLRAMVVIDTTFSGLEFENQSESTNLNDCLNKYPDLEVCILGGPAKEFACGGLRVGYAWTRSRSLARTLRSACNKPHDTILHMYKKILGDLAAKKDSLVQHLQNQKLTLRKRALSLAETLRKGGWDVLIPGGGLFLVAKPTQGVFNVLAADEILNDENICATVFERTGVLINSPKWTNLTGYCRFVLSVEERIFDEACKRLDSCIPENSEI